MFVFMGADQYVVNRVTTTMIFFFDFQITILIEIFAKFEFYKRTDY